MEMYGEIVFAIADKKNIDVEFDIQPTRIVKKGEVVALGRKAPKNKWMYIVKFSEEKEMLEKIEALTDLMISKKDSIVQIIDKYESVSMDVYLRTISAQIGFSMPTNILKKLAELGCTVNFNILSFGMVENDDD